MVESTAEVSRGTGPKLECDRVFRFIVWNWNEPTNQPQPTEIFDIADCLNKLLGAGTRVVITTTSNAPVLSYMIDSIHKTHRRKLFLATNDEGTVFGFDHRGMPVEVVHRALSGRGAALKYFIEREIRPLAVDSAQILVIDDAPSEGSAGVNTQSSVWLEECVGPSTWSRCALAQVADVLRRQTDLDARLGDFAVPRDAAWTIVESGFDMAREHEIESLLAIANGYVGVRGSIAEGSAVSRPATFLAGVFEQSSDVSPVPELVIAPDWGRLRFTIEGELFSAASTTMHHHHRTLDMRRGVLLREGIAIGDGGHATEIRTLHAASMAARHLLIEFVEIVPRNFSGTVQIDAILSGDVRSESGGVHWNRFEPRDCRQGPMLVGMTRAGFQLALTSHTNAVSGPDSIMNCRREFGPTSAMERCELHVRLGERSILHRIVGMYSSRDEGDPVIRAESLEHEVARVSSMELLDEHAAAWEARWQRADIEIDGAPKIERHCGLACTICSAPFIPPTHVRRLVLALCPDKLIGATFFGIPKYSCCRFIRMSGPKRRGRSSVIVIERSTALAAKPAARIIKGPSLLGNPRIRVMKQRRQWSSRLMAKSFPFSRESKNTISAPTSRMRFGRIRALPETTNSSRTKGRRY